MGSVKFQIACISTNNIPWLFDCGGSLDRKVTLNSKKKKSTVATTFGARVEETVCTFFVTVPALWDSLIPDPAGPQTTRSP